MKTAIGFTGMLLGLYFQNLVIFLASLFFLLLLAVLHKSANAGDAALAGGKKAGAIGIGTFMVIITIIGSLLLILAGLAAESPPWIK